MPETPLKRQTEAARETFLSKFPDDESRREHMRAIAARGGARPRMSTEDIHALASAYDLIRGIAQRHGFTHDEDGEPTAA